MRTDVMIKYLLIVILWIAAFVLLWVAVAFNTEHLKEALTTTLIAVVCVGVGYGLEKW